MLRQIWHTSWSRCYKPSGLSTVSVLSAAGPKWLLIYTYSTYSLIFYAKGDFRQGRGIEAPSNESGSGAYRPSLNSRRQIGRGALQLGSAFDTIPSCSNTRLSPSRRTKGVNGRVEGPGHQVGMMVDTQIWHLTSEADRSLPANLACRMACHAALEFHGRVALGGPGRSLGAEVGGSSPSKAFEVGSVLTIHGVVNLFFYGMYSSPGWIVLRCWWHPWLAAWRAAAPVYCVDAPW